MSDRNETLNVQSHLVALLERQLYYACHARSEQAGDRYL